jgi:hypothetical protein
MELFLAYLVQILRALTQLANALIPPLTGTLSYAGESLSARCYRAWRDGRTWGRVLLPVIDTIFFWQQQHCRNAYLHTFERCHLPPEYRNPPETKGPL